MKAIVPEFPVQVILTTGATTLAKAVPKEYLPRVLLAYNKSLDQVFYVPVAMATLSVFGAAAMQWRSVKGKKIDMAGGA
jgi:hypothetical protein